MELTKKLQVYIKIMILFATIGTAHSATERQINQTSEIVTVRYETPKSNASVTNLSVIREETSLSDSPVNLTDYYDSSEEVSDEIFTKRDSDPSTTQKYENSKLLFSYVVPVTSEKVPQSQKKEEAEAEKEDNEDVAVDEEEDVRGDLEEEEEEKKTRNSESDVEEYTEEEEEEEEKNTRNLERDVEEYTEEEEEEEERRPFRLMEEEEGEEEEERRPYRRRKDFDERGKYNDESDEEHYGTEEDHARTGDEVRTERGSTRAPNNPWRHNYPHLIREKIPFSDFTTIQPYSDPRPVSYSSVVYNPDGKTKTELSGSFYKKPLKLVPESGVFQTDEEHVSENTKTVPVTTSPIIEERSIKSSEEQINDEEEEEEEDYIEPEAMTSNVLQDGTTVAPKRILKPVEPILRPNYDWEEEEEEEEEDYIEPEAVTSNINYKKQDTVTVMPKRTPKRVQPIRKQNYDWEEEDPESLTSSVMDERQDTTTAMPERTPKLIHPIPRRNFIWQGEREEEPITERYEEMEYFEEAPREVSEDKTNPKRFNEKTSQQFRDKSNRENYYEQTINTRFGSKEKGTSEEDKNYESEAGDLMKPKVEQWRHETVQENVVSEEDEVEPEHLTESEPTKKDRNQLYEYLIADGHFKQGVSENKESFPRYVLTTTKKEEVIQTEAPATLQPPPTTQPPKPETTVTPRPKFVKPQRYSFGTITNPQSDQFMTFKNGDTDDVTYNRIVSNIQSLFQPPTRRPIPNYEQHFLPSHGNCQHRLPDHQHDSINYESFIKPSQTRPSYEEEVDEEEDEVEEQEHPVPKRLPMKTFIVQKRLPPPRLIAKKQIHYLPVKKPSAVKVTVHPVPYREAKPVTYRNAVYLGPAASPNQVIRKVIYYTPKDRTTKYHYSPTNQIMRIIRPQPPKTLPSSRMLIIRKIEQAPS